MRNNSIIKRFFFIASVLATCYNSLGQKKGDFLLGLKGSYSALNKDRDLKQFQDEYNLVWANDIDKNWSKTGVPFGYSFEAIYWPLDNLGFFIGSSSLRYKESVLFKDGSKREFDHKLRNQWDFGVSIGNSKIWTKFRLGVGNSVFTSARYSKDGEIDMNYNSGINGVYSSFGFTYGADLHVKIFKNCSVFISYFKLSGSEYTDKNFMKGIDRNNLYENVFFPKDYTLYHQTTDVGRSYDYTFDHAAKAKWTNISIGIQYQIKLFNSEIFK